jgi:tetratricopeptide (TPR) repeat protein
MQRGLGWAQRSMNCGLSGGAGKPLVLVCLTLGLALSATAQRQQRPHRSVTQVSQVQIQGTVRAEGESKHIPSAVVRLEDLQARVVAEEEVSTNGQFCITGLDPLPYTLIVTANGYETYVQRLDLTSVGGMNAVVIILKPNKTEVTGPSARTDATAPTKARKELERGLRASEERRLSEAHAHFETAVKIYPCYARAQVNLALTLMRESDSPRAEAPLKKAIECDPDFVEPYLQLGRLFSAQHRYDESRKILAEGVRRAPGSWQLYYHLGQADEGLKNYPLAAQELLRALSFGPDNSAAVHEKLADVYLRENSFDKAYTEMGAYLRIAPNGQYAARMRAIMQKLQSAGLVHPTQSQLLSGAPKL